MEAQVLDLEIGMQCSQSCYMQSFDVSVYFGCWYIFWSPILGYDFSSPSIASASSTVFVSPTNNVEIENTNVKTDLASENIDKGKSILGAPPK